MPVPETHEGDHPEPSKRNYLLKTDGSGTGTIDNPAQGAIGVVLRDPDGQLIEEISKPIGPAINTVAEYRALIEGLKLARSRGIQRIRVFLDSELVVDQVNGRAKVGKEHLRPLHTEACSLLQEFPNIRISWVPRKWNAEADALATKALLGRPAAHVDPSETRDRISQYADARLSVLLARHGRLEQRRLQYALSSGDGSQGRDARRAARMPNAL